MDHEIALQGFRHKLGELKQRFSGHRMASMVQFKVGEELLNSDAIVERWLNAFEYHREDDKRQAIEALHGVLPADACEFVFFGVLQEKGLAILELASMIDSFIRAPANADSPIVS